MYHQNQKFGIPFYSGFGGFTYFLKKPLDREIFLSLTKNMTWKEFKDKHKNVPDNAPVAICLSDGELDYVILTWYCDNENEFKENFGTLVVSGN